MNNWHILGAGAIGSLFASALHDCGAAVTLLARGETTKRYRNYTLHTQGVASCYQLPLSATSDNEAICRLLVTTKANDVIPALASVAHRLPAGATVVLAVNGMGLLSVLTELYPKLQWYACTTTSGAYRKSRKTIVHAGSGETRLGKFSAPFQPPPDWFQLWQQALTPCYWEQHIDQVQWHKLAINCAINPLTAIHRCENGVLGRNAILKSEVEKLCQEIIEVSTAAGYLHTAQNIETDVLDVIAKTADNRSSMLQDIQRGQKTEVEFITGYFCKIAQQLAIAVPHNQSMLEQVRAVDLCIDNQGTSDE